MTFYVGTGSLALFLTLIFWPLGLIFTAAAVAVAILRRKGLQLQAEDRGRSAGINAYMGVK